MFVCFLGMMWFDIMFLGVCPVPGSFEREATFPLPRAAKLLNGAIHCCLRRVLQSCQDAESHKKCCAANCHNFIGKNG